MKTFVLFVFVGFAAAQLPQLMPVPQAGRLSMGASHDICLPQCVQQCHAVGMRSAAVLPGTLRHIRNAGQLAFLQGGMPSSLSGMSLMSANNPGMITVSGGNRNIPMSGFNGMAAGAMNGMGLGSEGMMATGGVHVTESVKTVQPSGQVSVKG